MITTFTDCLSNISGNSELPATAIQTDTIKTGFTELDEKTGGFLPGEVVLIGGRPGMGKTSLAISMALNMVNTSKLSVLYYTLEMDAKDLIKRVLSTSGKVANHKFMHSCLDEDDAFAIAKSASKLADSNFYVEDSAGKSIEELCEEVKRFSSQGTVDVIIFDYLQLMRCKNSELSVLKRADFILKELSCLAKELDIALVVLSQLARAQEPRTIPILSDLRISDHYADTVLLLHRESYYMQKDADGYEAAVPLAEIIVRKHVSCTNEVIQLRWEPEYGHFSVSAELRNNSSVSDIVCNEMREDKCVI